MLNHISYSQYNTYTKCPRQWYLSKIRQAEELQTWYLPIGSAVHGMIEDYIKEEYESADQLSAEHYFYPLIEKQMLIEPDLSKWMAGGPQADPIVEEKALARVSECFSKALEELEAIDVWEVEYEASGRLPGLSVPLKAFVDIIGEHKKRKVPVIWDWKTGSTKPDNFQLITYAALLSGQNFGMNFRGRYVMLAPGSANTRYVDLMDINPAEVGAKYQAVVDRIEGKHYEAKAGFNCKFCFNQDNCMVNSGITKRTSFYDHSSDEGYPF